MKYYDIQLISNNIEIIIQFMIDIFHTISTAALYKQTEKYISASALNLTSILNLVRRQ